MPTTARRPATSQHIVDAALEFVYGGINALSTSAERVQTATDGHGYLTVVNLSTTITIYVGLSTVTQAGANGIAILPGTARTAYYADLATIYAVADSGTPSISWCVER